MALRPTTNARLNAMSEVSLCMLPMASFSTQVCQLASNNKATALSTLPTCTPYRMPCDCLAFMCTAPDGFAEKNDNRAAA
jgi:hypothetical protein